MIFFSVVENNSWEMNKKTGACKSLRNLLRRNRCSGVTSFVTKIISVATKFGFLNSNLINLRGKVKSISKSSEINIKSLIHWEYYI